MICGVFGLPRCGKSTFLSYCAQRAIKRKTIVVGHGAWHKAIGDFAPYDRVYSNFAIKGCFKIEFSDLSKYDFENCLIIIDEIMLFCDSRDFKTFDKKIKEFLALAGHYKCDILYASQGYDDTDKRIRTLTERIFYIDRWGAWSRVRPVDKTWSFCGDIVPTYTLAPPLSSLWLWRRRYYKYFDSFVRPLGRPSPPAVPW